MNIASIIICSEFQKRFKENDVLRQRGMLLSLSLHHKRGIPALKFWACGFYDEMGDPQCNFGWDVPRNKTQAEVDAHVAQHGGPHETVHEEMEDYYPHLDILLFSPTNYTKVYVRERDVHHFGTGPWVKVSDHDSCWRDGVHSVLQAYEPCHIGDWNGWYKEVETAEYDLPMEHGSLKQVVYLPGLTRGGV